MGAAKITSRIASVVALLLDTEGLLRLSASGRYLPRVVQSALRVLGAGRPHDHRLHYAAADFHARMVLNEAAWYYGTSSAGLWIATVALLFLVMQLATRSSLLRLRSRGPIGVRHLHLGMAGILIVLTGVHVVLSGLSKEMK